VAEDIGCPEGLSSTIRCGIDAINQGPQPLLGALLMLADQPLITSIELVRLIEAFRKQIAPIVASQYQIGNEVVRGVPEPTNIRYFLTKRANMKLNSESVSILKMRGSC
jgi:CTP:molybdopterin cytidylyltransferase MocA